MLNCCTVATLSAGSAKELPHPVFVRSSPKPANRNAGRVTASSVLLSRWPASQAVAGTLCSALACLPKHTPIEEEQEEGRSEV